MRYRILGIVVGLSLSIIVVLIIFSLNTSAGDVWVPEIVDVGSGNSNGRVSMALDSNDYPHFAHSNEHNLEYVYWNGVEWNIESVERGHQGCTYINIVLDSQDRPHISYSRWDSVLYAHTNGGEWIVETIDTGTGSRSNDIIVDGKDRPHIVYSSPNNSSTMYAKKNNSAWILERVPSTGGSFSITFDSQENMHISSIISYALYWTRWNGSEWISERVDGSADFLLYTEIQVDSFDYPHIAYFDWENKNLNYAKYNGWDFDIEIVDSNDAGHHISMILDSLDQPHISYVGEFKLKYASWNGTVWKIDDIDTDLPGETTSIVLDSSEKPHIGYNYIGNYEIKHAFWNVISWDIEIVKTGGNAGLYTSIALDSMDYSHISYYDETNGDLKYARWTGTGWIKEVVDPGGDVGLYTSIALDSNGNPHISYFDATGNDLKYANWTGSDWNLEFVDVLGDVGMYTSIAIDSSDSPHISYYSITDGDLKYAKRLGMVWIIESVDFTGDVGMFTSIALDSSDYPHICYYDSTNGDLKYTNWTGSEWNNQTVDSGGNVGRGGSLVLDSMDYPHISYFNATYNSTKYATWNGTGWFNETINKGWTMGHNTTIALDSMDVPHICFYSLNNESLYDETLMIAVKDGSSWTINFVEYTMGVGLYPSLAMGSDDYGRVSYYDFFSDDLRYAREEFNNAPWIQILTPPAGDTPVDIYYNISWIDEDIDSNANITLWLSGAGAIRYWWGVENTWSVNSERLFEDPEGPGKDSYNWSTVGINDGEYYIYGIIYDGYNSKVFDVSEGRVVIAHRPSVSNILPSSGYHSSDVTITYRLIDPNYSNCNVFINWSLNGVDWFVCTEGTGGDGTTGLSSSYPGGTLHTFVWDSMADLPGVNTTVFISITPKDGYIGTGDNTSFVVDNEAPVPELLSPLDDPHISGVFNLTVISGIDTVSARFYFYNGTWYYIGFAQHNDITGEWYFLWNTTGMDMEGIIVSANVTDAVGLRGSNLSAGIEIDNTPPSPSIVAPIDDEHIGGIYRLSAVSDNDTITVEFFYYDGLWYVIGLGLYNAGPDEWYLDWDTTGLDLDNLTISANVTDEVGLRGTWIVVGIEIDNTQPSPQILTPLDNDHITGYYNITVSSDLDTVSIEFVYFEGNWHWLGWGSYDPDGGLWYLVWNTSGLNLEGVTLYANATDEMIYKGTGMNIGIEIDNTLPSPFLITPIEDEHITGFYNLTCESDADTSGADFYYNDGMWHFIGTGSYDLQNNKWFFEWDTRGLNLTGITISVNVTDDAGLEGTYSSLGIEIDNAKPEPDFIAPSDNEHINGLYELMVSSDVDTESIEFNYFDGMWHFIGSGLYDPPRVLWSCFWDTTGLDVEGLIISANVTDEVGLEGYNTITGIEIDNTIPTPALLTPLEGETIIGIFNLTATSDSDTVDLDFYYYHGNWNFIGPGQYDSQSDMWIYTWDTFGLDMSKVRVYANATDELGHMGSVHNPGITIDNTGPEIISTLPDGAEENVTVDILIVIRFTEPIDTGVFEDYLSSSQGNADYVYVWNTEHTIVTITSSTELEQNRTYTVFLGTEIVDVSGNQMAAEYTWTFRTLLDTDNDGLNDYADNDDDNDDVQDSDDAFPKDPMESVDTDNDGIGNNADLDDDDDGHFDDEDAYPLDPEQWKKGDDTEVSGNTWIWFAILGIVIVCIILFTIFFKKREGSFREEIDMDDQSLATGKQEMENVDDNNDFVVIKEQD